MSQAMINVRIPTGMRFRDQLPAWTHSYNTSEHQTGTYNIMDQERYQGMAHIHILHNVQQGVSWKATITPEELVANVLLVVLDRSITPILNSEASSPEVIRVNKTVLLPTTLSL